MDFITPLITWLTERWDEFKFIIFVRDYEEVLIYRAGKSNRILKGGLHFKIPFYEDMVSFYVADDTLKTPSQKLHTKDGIPLTVNAVVLYHVDDSLAYGTRMNEAKQAISDFTEVHIARNVVNTDFIDCNNERLMRDVEIDLRRTCKKYGIVIDSVTITTITKSKSLNIFNETEPHL